VDGSPLNSLAPTSNTPDPSGHRARGVRLALGWTLLGGLALAGAWTWNVRDVERRREALGSSHVTQKQSAVRGSAPSSFPKPRVAAPDPGYVGDQACMGCHAEISQSYASHPMGRSLRPIRESPLLEHRPASPTSFEALGLRFEVLAGDGSMQHRETLAHGDSAGAPRNQAEVRYIVGSGRRAFTFLVERGDGFLFQSPITWYSGDQLWDLAPGYDRNSPHFERPIRPACLYCHANQVEHYEGSENHYRNPIFRGHAIGCERCHGPGRDHVRQPFLLEGEPTTIVNPARLAPPLREAVCQQCHLQGDVRIDRAGRLPTDYRPGLPLHEFIEVYFQESKRDVLRFVGQVEQMHASRCFQASGGTLGCISCHDPHRIPNAAERITHFRNRCLQCHRSEPQDPPVSEQGERLAGACVFPVEERLRRSPQENCIECHMPRAANSRIPHTATSDHRIPRDPTAPGDPSQTQSSRAGTGDLAPLFSFFDELRERDRTQSREPEHMRGRDLGVALSIEAPNLSGRAVNNDASAADQLAVRLLEGSLQHYPDDPPAWQAMGRSLWRLGHHGVAFAAFQEGLRRSPHNESILLDTASRAAQLGRTELAESLTRQLIDLNPWRASYHQLMGLVQFQARNWTEAARACRAALVLNAHDLEVRLMLVQALLRSGDRPGAEAEFAQALPYAPAHGAQLRRWFTAEASRGPLLFPSGSPP